MSFVRKTVVQSFLLVSLSVALGLGVNALRPDGLPLAGAAPSAVALPGETGEIALKDAALLSFSGRAVFLDARTAAEYADGHIQGAKSVPVDDFELVFPRIEKDLAGKEAVISYCDGERCPLSGELAEKLAARGVKNVFVLKNGWTLWSAEGLPTGKGQ